ncbi:MAG: two-component sensor histidine kinase [Rhodobacteraceae bacterium]|nr:two-component sensor histidine kinase [Paracoccaceae bacterium]
MSDQLVLEFLAALPVAALLVDQSERIIAANADARTLLGQQIVRRHFATILRQPELLEGIETCLRRHAPRKTRFLSNNGGQGTVYEVSCRYITGGGRLAQGGAALIAFQDQTHMEQVEQMRRDFVANVGHELRTPLTALMGFIETLRGPARDDTDARDRFLTIMEGEANRMNRLVGDLLSLSRVESEEHVRPRDRVDLLAELNSTLESLGPLGEKAGVISTISAPTDPVHVAGDADQLRQVFTNLVENAIKYGGSGGVVQVMVTLSARDATLRAPAVRVQVIDRGPGIDPIHLPRLTQRFYRADNHRSRELGGTGLGLAIVKHIINRHRGRLRVESEPGQGSVFTVILPTILLT